MTKQNAHCSFCIDIYLLERFLKTGQQHANKIYARTHNSRSKLFFHFCALFEAREAAAAAEFEPVVASGADVRRARQLPHARSATRFTIRASRKMGMRCGNEALASAVAVELAEDTDDVGKGSPASSFDGAVIFAVTTR